MCPSHIHHRKAPPEHPQARHRSSQSEVRLLQQALYRALDSTSSVPMMHSTGMLDRYS
jgi:hypothetical protein